MQNNINNVTNNGGEAIKLLELSSSDSLDSPNFTHFTPAKPKRKVRFKKVFRPKSKSAPTLPSRAFNCRLGDAAKLLGCFLLMSLVVALVWYVINLNTRIQELQKQFNDIKGFNRNTPEQLHTIHAQLKDLEFNVSSLLVDIKRNRVEIENATAEIRQLKEATVSLQDSIAAAPAIKSLPKDVDSLSKSVAAFGSKLTAMESIVKELKDGQTSVQGTTQNLSTEFENIKMTVQELSNATKANASESRMQLKPLRDLTFQSAIDNTKQSVTALQQELLDLTQEMDRMNTTLGVEILNLNRLPAQMENSDSILTFLKNNSLSQDKRLLSVETFSYYNVSSRLQQLEVMCSLDKPQQYSNISEILELVNKTVTEAVVNIVHSDLFIDDEGKNFGNSSRNLVVDTYNGLTFLAGLLKQFNQVALREMITEKNATAIVSHFLTESFHDLMKDHDVKLQELQNEVNRLSAYIAKSLDTSTVSQGTSTEGQKSSVQDHDNSTALPTVPAA